MNYYMESTWNSAWVSITLMVMMILMEERIVTGLNILIFKKKNLFAHVGS